MRTPGSGRKKGTLNKERQNLFEVCAKHGVDVFEGMVILASEEEDPDKRFDKLDRLAQYLYPKPKSVEVTGDQAGIALVIKDYTK